MKFKELTFNGKTTVNPKEILSILEKNNFHWIIDSETEDAKIEIKNNTLIWHDGIYYSGNWHYGIFKGGSFYGKFENGIFENGVFGGKFISGINLVEI